MQNLYKACQIYKPICYLCKLEILILLNYKNILHKLHELMAAVYN